MDADRDGSRVTAVTTRAAGHDARYAAPWFVLAGGGFGSGAIELDSRWATHDRVLDLPLRGVPAAGEPRFLADYLAEQPMARVGVAVDAELRAEGAENVLVAGAALPGAASWREGSGEGIASGEWLPRRAARAVAIRRRGGSGRMSDGILDDLLRGSIDHCVKCTICETQCPVSNVTPLFPGPKYAGPQAERYRIADEPSRRVVGRLLLGVWHLLAGLPPGSEDRRGQRPGPQQAQAPEGRPAPRPDHHPPDLARPRRHTGGAAGQPVVESRPLRILAEKRSKVHRDAPRRSSPAGGSRAGPADERVLRPGARSSTSTAAAPSTTSRGRGRRSYRSSSTTASRSRSPSRTAAGCRCSRAACSTTRARSCCASPAHLAPYVRNDPDTIIVGNATSCTLMLKREAREILGLEDDPDLKLVSERTYDICELLLELHDRGELRTDFRPMDETVAYHAPCQQQGHWIGKPALELLALIPSLRRRGDERSLLRDRRDLRPEGGEVRRSRWRSVGTCSTRSAPRELRPSPATARPAGGRSRTAPAARRCIRSTTCFAHTDSTATRPADVVGIVVVSHSDALAEGVVKLAREMGGEGLALEPAGGIDEPGVLGTDPMRIRAAIERAMSVDGVLVLMDLGSALMSTEFAIEMLPEGSAEVLMSDGPLVEGAVAAAAAARGGATLAEVAAEARRALAMKAGQLGAPEPGRDPDGPRGEELAPADATATVVVRNEIGLHARPAARLVETVRRFDADVRIATARSPSRSARRASPMWWGWGRGSATRCP